MSWGLRLRSAKSALHYDEQLHMTAFREIVFLLDVDNTLLDNDQVIADLRAHLEGEFGATSASRYWELYESARNELGYADYLGALQRFRWDSDPTLRDDPRMLQSANFLLDYPFAERLYPRALAVIERLNAFGPTVILSDGESVFQPRKVQRSGIWDAVSGRVLIYIHKEQMLDAVQRSYPAQHYVMVDDKLRVLAAMKTVLQDRLTTIFPRQGHYALDPTHTAAYPPADLAVERIGDLIDFDIGKMRGPPKNR